ncbi:MAG TPA: hypothetical protein VNS79_03270 [Sphingobium sp.]|nr:hypothetical protein [Sphingobium sp.]
MKGAGNPEPRPAASLTGSLLARRGGARPAMRRQPVISLHATGHAHEDLGWNDMGEDSGAAEAAASMILAEPDVAQVETEARAAGDEAHASPIARQIDLLAARMATSTRKPPSRTGLPASLADTGRKVAFTLRIDAERHLRLRLLSALTNRSAQHLLTEALDSMIAQHEALAALVDQVEHKPAATAGKGRGL